MAEVEQAERRLLMTRRAVKKAYKADGRDTDGMFGKTAFVPRESAEKWVEEAKAEAAKTVAAPPDLKPNLAAFQAMADRAAREREGR